MRDTMNENENTENAAPGNKGRKKSKSLFVSVPGSKGKIQRSREPALWFNGEPYYLLLLK